ncbi:MAG: DNA/RNA nuclease SfsA [Candidatus Rokubacteria bacterium]|nr:DNA/RNA nuclease SfsA [Candidatus Rokubacteria bacterium]
MRFRSPLISGRLVRRYQRFPADVRLDDWRLVTAHCPNSGSLLGCKEPGSPVYLSHHPGVGRRLAWTWEMVRVGRTWVGVNTLRAGGLAAFPDAVTERGRKHLRELVRLARRGHRAALVFVVQRGDCAAFRPADEVDPEYGRWLRRALDAGVEILPYRVRVTPRGITLTRRLALVLEARAIDS